MSEPSMTHAFALALSQITESLQPVIEAMNGYRARLLQEGYSETAAEAMCIEYHSLIIHQLIRASKA